MIIFMDSRFLSHNAHLEDPEHFAELDPQLRRLRLQKYIWVPALLEQLPIDVPGIYTLGGGRQIGKTTLLKQWMEKLLRLGIPPTAIAFFSGELIDNQHTLVHLLQNWLSTTSNQILRYVLLDEVTYIQHWDKGIKFAADAGWLDNVELILTGSDLILMQEARMRFPGRRGKAETVNFHLFPLSFRESVILKHGNIREAKADSGNNRYSDVFVDLLFDEFNMYLMHGGFLTAINDIALHGRILEATLMTYSDWIRGDMLKRGKQEHYLREILDAIVKRYGSQVTWNALAQDLSIDHPKTVADYTALLESMDAVFVQHALLEDKLVAAPKKGKKIMFADPFIFHAINTWLHPVKNPFEAQIKSGIDDPIFSSKLVESCVATHYHRFYPTYYIKAEGEIDVAYVHNNRFWPVEIKWTNQLRTKDLKQIAKYPNGRILTKTKQAGVIQSIKSGPLPLALWEIQ